jgi:DUF1016 N-terminal domain
LGLAIDLRAESQEQFYFVTLFTQKSIIDARQQEPEEVGFSEIIRLIGASRERAIQAVNTALIDLYWQIGEIISRGVAAAQWGEGHLQILGQCKLTEEREFYLRMAVPRRLEQSPVGTAGVRFGNGH